MFYFERPPPPSRGSGCLAFSRGLLDCGPPMFETLTKGFRSAKQRFQGVAELDEATVNEALSHVRTSLVEADVGYDVVTDFCNRVREKAVGVIVKVKASTKEKVRRVSPEDHFVKLCHHELIHLM